MIVVNGNTPGAAMAFTFLCLLGLFFFHEKPSDLDIVQTSRPADVNKVENVDWGSMGWI
jgi:hypothetical protein